MSIATLYTAAISTITFVVTLWVAWSLHRYIYHDRGEIPLRTRLLHPMTTYVPTDKRRS